MSDFIKKKLNMSLNEINSMEKRSYNRRRNNNRFQYRNKYSSNNSRPTSRNYLQKRRNYTSRYPNERNHRPRFSQRKFIAHPTRRYNDERRYYNQGFRKRNVNKEIKDGDETRTRLFVSNLHKSIVNNELKKIFENIGPLKRCGVRWDNLGNSLGTADVEYDSPLDAEKAIKCFNNAEIEGTIMKVEYNLEKKLKPKKRIFRKRLGLRKRSK